MRGLGRLAILCSVCITACDKHGDTEMEARLSVLSEMIESLQSRAAEQSSLESEIESLEKETAEQESESVKQIQELEAKLAATESDISAYQEQAAKAIAWYKDHERRFELAGVEAAKRLEGLDEGSEYLEPIEPGSLLNVVDQLQEALWKQKLEIERLKRELERNGAG